MSYSKEEQLKRRHAKKSRTQLNKDANKVLNHLYRVKGIAGCELCGNPWANSYHHRHKRGFYVGDKRKLLKSFNQTLKVCPDHHAVLESNRILTEAVFEYLRGKEKLDNL